MAARLHQQVPGASLVVDECDLSDLEAVRSTMFAAPWQREQGVDREQLWAYVTEATGISPD